MVNTNQGLRPSWLDGGAEAVEMAKADGWTPDVSAQHTPGPWTPVPHYGFGENANRVEFWSAKNDAGQQFKDDRGVSCFDYADLLAAIAKATGSAA